MPNTTNGVPYVSSSDYVANYPTVSQNLANFIDPMYASMKRLGYQTRTTNYTSDQTTLSAAADMFSSDITWTALGSTTYWVEFFCPRLIFSNTAGQSVALDLVDGSGNGLGCAALLLSGSATGNQVFVHVRVPYTPAAGSRSINFRAPYTAGLATSVWAGGNGGTGIFDPLPMWMAVYGPDIS